MFITTIKRFPPKPLLVMSFVGPSSRDIIPTTTSRLYPSVRTELNRRHC